MYKMKKGHPVAAVIISMLGVAVLLARAAEPNTDMQTAKEFKFQKVTQANVKYLLFLPKGYEANSGKRWPLMLFLHGAGERGSDVWKVATHGPPKIVAHNPDFPFILVSPQCPEGEIWSGDQLLGLLDEITKTLQVDPRRVYLTGLSMGGYGTWDLGLSHPDRFAAIVPICGGGQLINILLAEGAKGKALKSLGVWAFHGGKDPIVPLEESQRMVEMLKKVGVKDVQLTVYPETGHDSWIQAYDDPKLYEWLLSHERKP
jgi:predicted peptidase